MKNSEERAKKFNGYSNNKEKYWIKYENENLAKRIISQSPTVNLKKLNKDFEAHMKIIKFRKELFNMRVNPAEPSIKSRYSKQSELKKNPLLL